MKCLTYNIRYDNPNDGENRWELRKEHLGKQILFYEPEIFGIQEGLKHQVDFLKKFCTAYEYVGVGRDDGKEDGEYAALFYKTTQFTLLESGNFWLSKTPNMPSKSWDAALPRVCTYALLEFKGSAKKIWVFNTHFDHQGEQARIQASRLILQKIKQLNPKAYPVILMGDFNAKPDDEPIKALTKTLGDSFEMGGALKFGPLGTFNGFQIDYSLGHRIDYIFLTKDAFVLRKYAVLSEVINHKFLSDHFPVFLELDLK